MTHTQVRWGKTKITHFLAHAQKKTRRERGGIMRGTRKQDALKNAPPTPLLVFLIINIYYVILYFLFNCVIA